MSAKGFSSSRMWLPSSTPPLSSGNGANPRPASPQTNAEDPVHEEYESEQDVVEGYEESDGGHISDSYTGSFFSCGPPDPGTDLQRTTQEWSTERKQLCRLRQHISTHFWLNEAKFETVVKPLIVKTDETDGLMLEFRSSPYCPEPARILVYEGTASIELSAEDEAQLVEKIQATTRVVSDVMDDWDQREYLKLENEAPARLAQIQERNQELTAALADVGFTVKEDMATHASDADMMNTAVGQARKKGLSHRLKSWSRRRRGASGRVYELKPKGSATVRYETLKLKFRSALRRLRGGSNVLQDQAPDVSAGGSAAAVTDSRSSARTVELDEHGEEFLAVPDPGEWYRSSRRPRVSASNTGPSL